MRQNEIIGGEFDIDVEEIQHRKSNKGCLDNVYKYSSGRSALFYILLDIKKRYNIQKVFFPDYLCSSVVKAAQSAEMDIIFYELNENLEIDEKQFANIYDKQTAVLIINYFGLQDIGKQVEYVRSLNTDAIIIEDDVQAYYEFRKDLNNTNYKFTSLRKTFACTDGGLVKSFCELPEIEMQNKFYQYKLAGSILKSLRMPEYYDDEVFLQLFEKGEALVNDDIAHGMSKIAIDIISKTDTDNLADVRIRNAQCIVKGLNNLGIRTILPISKDKIPLFVPIYLEDRNMIRKFLFGHNVFCPVHWPLDGMKVKKGTEMDKHELSIIIDQRYTNDDMMYILDLLEKVVK